MMMTKMTRIFMQFKIMTPMHVIGKTIEEEITSSVTWQEWTFEGINEVHMVLMELEMIFQHLPIFVLEGNTVLNKPYFWKTLWKILQLGYYYNPVNYIFYLYICIQKKNCDSWLNGLKCKTIQLIYKLIPCKEITCW